MKLLKFQLYKVTVAHALQPCDLASKINFSNWFWQSVHDGEVDHHLTFFFPDEAWFHLHGHVFPQNHRYWSLINKVLP
jgi:hypothetical protein